MENELVDQVDESVVEDTPQTEVETLEDDSAPEENEQQENPEDKAEDKPKDEYSKKARKAIKFREKLLSKEREKNAAYERELSELKARFEAFESGKQAVDSKPKQENFSTWEDYNEALADWKVDQKLKDYEAKKVETTTTTKQEDEKTQYNQERMHYHEQRAVELSKLIPDYAQVISDVSDEVDDLPLSHQELLLELDDAPSAVYVLALEDKLERLGRMPLSLAAAELIRARDKAAQYIQPAKTITKTPPPVNGARGVGGSTRKSLDNMSAKDIIKWAQS